MHKLFVLRSFCTEKQFAGGLRPISLSYFNRAEFNRIKAKGQILRADMLAHIDVIRPEFALGHNRPNGVIHALGWIAVPF